MSGKRKVMRISQIGKTFITENEVVKIWTVGRARKKAIKKTRFELYVCILPAFTLLVLEYVRLYMSTHLNESYSRKGLIVNEILSCLDGEGCFIVIAYANDVVIKVS